MNEMEFSVGQIIEMSPGYHTIEPYYVLIKFYNSEAKAGDVKMITTIPGEHDCKMVVGSNWEYHYKRMKIIGDKKTYGYLLNNQKLQHK